MTTQSLEDYWVFDRSVNCDSDKKEIDFKHFERRVVLTMSSLAICKQCVVKLACQKVSSYRFEFTFWCFINCYSVLQKTDVQSKNKKFIPRRMYSSLNWKNKFYNSNKGDVCSLNCRIMSSAKTLIVNYNWRNTRIDPFHTPILPVTKNPILSYQLSRNSAIEIFEIL